MTLIANTVVVFSSGRPSDYYAIINDAVRRQSHVSRKLTLEPHPRWRGSYFIFVASCPVSLLERATNALPNAFTTYATRCFSSTRAEKKKARPHQRMQSERLHNRHLALLYPALLPVATGSSLNRGGLIARFSLEIVAGCWHRTKRVKKRERERGRKEYRWIRKCDLSRVNSMHRYFLSRGLHLLRRCTLVNAVVCGRNLSRHIRGHIKHGIWDPHIGKRNV